jgi:ABC-type nitrate/sulfonate/bicarbonate transport system permease component
MAGAQISGRSATSRLQAVDLTAAVGGVALRVSVLVGIVVVWQVLTTIADHPFFPTFAETFGRLWINWLTNPTQLGRDVVPSLARLLTGWFAAVVVGVALGVVIGMSRRIGDYLDPIAQFLRSIPPPALLPLFIVLLGIGDVMKVTMILFGVV